MESLSQFSLAVVKDRMDSCLTLQGQEGVYPKSNCQVKKQMKVSKNN